MYRFVINTPLNPIIYGYSRSIIKQNYGNPLLHKPNSLDQTLLEVNKIKNTSKCLDLEF